MPAREASTPGGTAPVRLGHSAVGAERGGDGGRIVPDMASGEADDGKAEISQLEIPPMVVLEGLATVVGFPAVDLDDQALSPPKEVDRVRADALVRGR